MNTKNENVHTLKILNDKNVYQVKNSDNTEEKKTFGSLTCFGGGAFHRGLSIGMQEKMIPGLLIYDDENFYGFSEKNGLTLLSRNIDFKELELPRFDSSLMNKEKELNIDLTLVDIENFYINVPNEIERYNIGLTFNVSFHYDDESVIHKINICVINNTQKNVKFVLKNKNMFLKGDKYDENNSSIIQFQTTFMNKNQCMCLINKYSHSL